MSQREWREKFAFRLRKKMRNKGLTQKDLSELTGISEDNISRYIKGYRVPGAYNLMRICTVLECRSDELLYFD